MIITQTPLRVSFLGGGTDLPAFYRRESGSVVSTAIDKYIFVIIKERFDDRIRIGYTRTELVDDIDELEHDLVRECLRKTGLTKGVEISTMGDIPSEGSGLGSSSTVTVGLLNAMYHYLGCPRDAETLAAHACEIEIDVLGKPIGKQDQYIAAYGGQRFIQFCPDDRVQVEGLELTEKVQRRFMSNLLLFNTSIVRKAESVLSEQVQSMEQHLETMREMKKLAVTAVQALRAGEVDEIGSLLHQGWLYKRSLASRISSSFIDELYQTALCAGALGGKITGAGGGGYLLLYCPPGKQEDVRHALHGLNELHFSFARDGSKVIFNNRQ